VSERSVVEYKRRRTRGDFCRRKRGKDDGEADEAERKAFFLLLFLFSRVTT
jgi:hypothetical protein